MTVSANLPAELSHLNTIALQCHAKRHVTLTAIDEVLPLFSELTTSQTPYIILSGGSNSILPPTLNATVISPRLLGKTVIDESADSVTLAVMAGENWHELVVDCTQNGWFGLENLALIPGWVGSCPVQNIGAYGVQVEDAIDRVTAFHIPTLTWHTLSKQDCRFAYRDSMFKQQAGDWLIATVTFTLSKVANPALQYGDVASVATDFAKRLGKSQPTPLEVMKAIIHIRSAKLPDPNVLPNCGSFFKNPIVATSLVENLLKTFPTLVHYPTAESEKVKVAGGWLIEHAGLKGKGVAPIFTHEKQALVLTNHTPKNAPCQATQANIEKAVRFIQNTVFDKFGILLEPEPVWVSENGKSGVFKG